MRQQTDHVLELIVQEALEAITDSLEFEVTNLDSDFPTVNTAIPNTLSAKLIEELNKLGVLLISVKEKPNVEGMTFKRGQVLYTPFSDKRTMITLTVTEDMGSHVMSENGFEYQKDTLYLSQLDYLNQFAKNLLAPESSLSVAAQ